MTDFNTLRANPGKLVEVSETHYDEAQGAVPPVNRNGFWSMGEAYDIAPNGEMIFYNYKRVGDRYFGCLATPAEASAAFASLADLSQQGSRSDLDDGPGM